MFLQWKQKNSIWNWKQHEYIKLMFFFNCKQRKERRRREKVFLWVKSCHIVESKLNNWAKCFGLLLMLLFMKHVECLWKEFSEKKSFYVRQTGAHKLLIAIFRDFGWFTNFISAQQLSVSGWTHELVHTKILDHIHRYPF